MTLVLPRCVGQTISQYVRNVLQLFMTVIDVAEQVAKALLPSSAP